MVSWNVTVDGRTLDAISEVEPVSGDEGRLGTCKVVCGATDANRTVASGDDAVVERNGTVEFDGKITKAPSTGANSDSIEYTISDNRVTLRYIQAHRPFYEMDTGEIIKDAVTKRAKTRSPATIHEGSSLTNWDSDIPEFSLLESDTERIHEYGSDLIFAGWPTGSSGVYSVTYDDVPASAIPGDGQVLRLNTRMLVNNRGNQIEAEINLRDNAGNNYNWSPERPRSEFTEYEFAAEDAVTEASIGDSLSTDGTLQYRFRLNGPVPEPRAVVLDHAETLPFVVETRDTDITVNNVQQSGNVITRRFDENVMLILRTLGNEDSYGSWIDENNDLHYEPTGSRSSGLSITDATPVTEYSYNRDYDQIVNQVTVQGAGNIQVTAIDNGSVDFYGISEREDQIIDREIQTEAEADRRAIEFLKDNAWDDSAITFEVADLDFADVSIGESVFISWSPEDTNKIFNVTRKEVSDAGYVTLNFSGHTEGAF